MSVKIKHLRTIAAAMVATIVSSVALCGCSGRKMSNMEPTGETVEVEVISAEVSDSVNGVVSAADSLLNENI